jgi:hypothetical protein
MALNKSKFSFFFKSVWCVLTKKGLLCHVVGVVTTPPPPPPPQGNTSHTKDWQRHHLKNLLYNLGDETPHTTHKDKGFQLTKTGDHWPPHWLPKPRRVEDEASLWTVLHAFLPSSMGAGTNHNNQVGVLYRRSAVHTAPSTKQAANVIVPMVLASPVEGTKALTHGATMPLKESPPWVKHRASTEGAA